MQYSLLRRDLRLKIGGWQVGQLEAAVPDKYCEDTIIISNTFNHPTRSVAAKSMAMSNTDDALGYHFIRLATVTYFSAVTQHLIFSATFDGPFIKVKLCIFLKINQAVFKFRCRQNIEKRLRRMSAKSHRTSQISICKNNEFLHFRQLFRNWISKIDSKFFKI